MSITSPATTACTGPSNSALASAITSSRDVRRDVGQQQHAARLAIRPASAPDRCRCVGRSGASVHEASHRERVGAVGQLHDRLAHTGVAAVDQGGAVGVGDPQREGLGGVVDQPGQHGQRAQPDRLPVRPHPDVEDAAEVVRVRRPAGDEAASSRVQVSAGPYMMPRSVAGDEVMRRQTNRPGRSRQ